MGLDWGGGGGGDRILYGMGCNSHKAVGTVSRKGRISIELFFDWIVLGFPSCRQPSRFYSAALLFVGGRCGEVLSYGSRTSVRSSVLCLFSASSACFTRDEPLFQPGWWRWT